MHQGFGGPVGGLVLMAGCARVGDLVFVGVGWRNEGEGVGTNLYLGDGGLDLRHVTSDAFASGRAIFMVSVVFQG